MREEYIKEEVMKGNDDVRQKASRIDMLPPPTTDDYLSQIEKMRDRSRSKSKS